MEFISPDTIQHTITRPNTFFISYRLSLFKRSFFNTILMVSIVTKTCKIPRFSFQILNFFSCCNTASIFSHTNLRLFLVWLYFVQWKLINYFNGISKKIYFIIKPLNITKQKCCCPWIFYRLKIKGFLDITDTSNNCTIVPCAHHGSFIFIIWKTNNLIKKYGANIKIPQ